MNEILDEDEIHKEVIDKRVENPIKIASVYLFLMLIGNYSCAYYELFTKSSSARQADIASCLSRTAILTVLFLSISLFAEILRFSYRKIRPKKQQLTLSNPFWFQVIEGSFGIAIILYIFMFLAHISQ